MSPAHTHDCPCCTFLDSIDSRDIAGAQADLYFCTQSGAGATVIARYGPGSDYISGLLAAKSGQIKDLAFALERAVEQGLYIPARAPPARTAPRQ